MNIHLARLGSTFKNQEMPGCACCGYDAEFALEIGTLRRYFCERDLVNALLDAVNFNCPTPSTP